MSKFFQVIFWDENDFPNSLGFFNTLEEVEKVKGTMRKKLIDQGFDEKRARLSVAHWRVSKGEMDFWTGQ